MKTRFAIVENQRMQPAPKLRGQCPLCGDEMLAKCGAVKIWHWSHKSRLSCDPWWENETDWHRGWKAHFPPEWQETVLFDSTTGEKHIADVQTSYGLTIEFQHSVMHPDELKAREAFYKNIIWIVDGNRGELDKSYFNLSRGGRIASNPRAHGFRWWGKSRLFANWSEAVANVYIDFGEEVVWRLVCYDEETKEGVVGPILRKTFIEDLLAGNPIRTLA